MFNVQNLIRMMSNPQIKQLFNSKNPQQLLSQMAKTSNNPMLTRAIELMNAGDEKGLEQYARNLMSNTGQNADEAYNTVKKLMGK